MTGPQETTAGAGMGRTRPVAALVVPCFNEEQAIPSAAAALSDILDRMIAGGIASPESFILFVNDGSTDRTWNLIAALHKSSPRFKGISLSANRGQQAALMAGLMEARPRCDLAVTIDADLQDSPEAIIDMVKQYDDGADIVFGVRSSRSSDSWFKRNSARAFYRMQKGMGLHTVYDHSEFRLMGRKALDILADYGESNLFLRGIMADIGLPSAVVCYDRTNRKTGRSKYSFRQLVSLSVDGITSFTARPMRYIFMTGLLLLVLDLVIAAWVFVSHFNGIAISGWSSLMLSVWFLGSLVLIALGIIGEYIGKIFTEVKHRPRYNVDQRLVD